ncbi:MAG: hypothetical protein AAGA32_15285 [Pseudomonadota bacterium]
MKLFLAAATAALIGTAAVAQVDMQELDRSLTDVERQVKAIMESHGAPPELFATLTLGQVTLLKNLMESDASETEKRRRAMAIIER